MPEIQMADLKKLAFPKGVREQYQALAWQDQKKYFLLMMIVGCLFFLAGALL